MVGYDTLKHYQAFVRAGMDERAAEALVYAIRDVGQEIRANRAAQEQRARAAAPALALVQAKAYRLTFTRCF